MKKLKIRISTWNFVYIKGSTRIVYGKNFRSFGCTLTEVWLSKRLGGLYTCILPYIISKINLSPFFTDMSKWAEIWNGEVSWHGLSSETLKSNIWK